MRIPGMRPIKPCEIDAPDVPRLYRKPSTFGSQLARKPIRLPRPSSVERKAQKRLDAIRTRWERIGLYPIGVALKDASCDHCGHQEGVSMTPRGYFVCPRHLRAIMAVATVEVP